MVIGSPALLNVTKPSHSASPYFFNFLIQTTPSGNINVSLTSVSQSPVIANNTTKPARPARKSKDRRPELLREFFATALVLAALKSGGLNGVRVKA